MADKKECYDLSMAELPCARRALAMTSECLARDGRIRDDAKRMKCIRKMSRDELCAHYHN